MIVWLAIDLELEGCCSECETPVLQLSVWKTRDDADTAGRVTVPVDTNHFDPNKPYQDSITIGYYLWKGRKLPEWQAVPENLEWEIAVRAWLDFPPYDEKTLNVIRSKQETGSTDSRTSPR